MEVTVNKIRVVCPAWHRTAMQCMEPNCPYPKNNPRFEGRVFCPDNEKKKLDVCSMPNAMKDDYLRNLASISAIVIKWNL